ncbi:hypothetical protein ACFPH6_26290 [Streptomyces xiangluensis]|uniref:Uncharacterized protein n=1 Tax=Streptomyces xiangluensis TaxID=2665720 RepID=A0ABV8YTZ5_9ACTN
MIRRTLHSRLRAAAGLLAFGLVCAALVVLPGTSPASAQPVVGPALFDDFNYTGYTDLL